MPDAPAPGKHAEKDRKAEERKKTLPEPEQKILDAYSRQVEALFKFYRAVDPTKDERACRAIIDKRRKHAAALSAAAWGDLCGRLTEKYGQGPTHKQDVGAAASDARNQTNDVEHDCRISGPQEPGQPGRVEGVVRGARPGQCAQDPHRRGNQAHVLSVFYGGHATQHSIAGILRGRKGSEVALHENGRGGFVHLCRRLASKFGGDPILLSCTLGHNFAHVVIGAMPDAQSCSSGPRNILDLSHGKRAMFDFNTVAALQSQLRVVRSAGRVDSEHCMHRLERHFIDCTHARNDTQSCCGEMRRQFDFEAEQWMAKNKALVEEHRAVESELAAAKQALLSQQSALAENQRLRRSAEETANKIQTQDQELQQFSEEVVRLTKENLHAQNDLHSANANMQWSARIIADATGEAKLAQQQANCARVVAARLSDSIVHMREEIVAQRGVLHPKLQPARFGHALGCLAALQGSGAMIQFENERSSMAAYISQLEVQCANLKAAVDDSLRDHALFTKLFKESQKDSELQLAELRVCLVSKTDPQKTIEDGRAETRQVESQAHILTQQSMVSGAESLMLVGQFSGVKDESAAISDVACSKGAPELGERHEAGRAETFAVTSCQRQSHADLFRPSKENNRVRHVLNQLILQLHKPALTMCKTLMSQETMAQKFSQLTTSLSETARQNADLRRKLQEVGGSQINLRSSICLLEEETGLLRKHVGQLMSTPLQTGLKRRRSYSGHVVSENKAQGQYVRARSDTELQRQVVNLQVVLRSLHGECSQRTLQAQLDQCVADLSENRKLWQQYRTALQTIVQQRDTFMQALRAELRHSVSRQGPTENRARQPIGYLKTIPSTQTRHYATETYSSRVDCHDSLELSAQTALKRARVAELALSQQRAELKDANLTVLGLRQSYVGSRYCIKQLQSDCERDEAAVRSMCLRLGTVQAELSTSQIESSRQSLSLSRLQGQNVYLRSRQHQLQRAYDNMAHAKRDVSMILVDSLASKQRDRQTSRELQVVLETQLRTAAEQTAIIGSRFQCESEAHEAAAAALATASGVRSAAEGVISSMRASRYGLRKLCSSLSKGPDTVGPHKNLTTAAATCSFDLTSKESGLSAELTAAQGEIVSLKIHVDEFRQLLLSKERAINAMQCTVRSKDSSLVCTEQKLSVSVSREHMLRAELTRTKATLDCSIALKRIADQKLLKVHFNKAQSSSELQKLQTLCYAQHEACYEREGQVAALKHSEALLKVNVARLEAMVAHASTATKEASAAHVSLAAAESAGHDKLVAVESRLTASASQLRKLRTENTSLRQCLDHALGALHGGATTDAAPVIDGLRETIKRLQGARDAAEAKLALVQQDVVQYKSQTQMLEIKLSSQQCETAPSGEASLMQTARSKSDKDVRAACQTIEAADATRAARDRLATQLEESDRARNKAKLEEVAAVAQRNEFERQKRDVEGALAVAQHEAHMWHTKLNTSTERVKLQKLHRELAEKNQNLTEQRQELLELEKKCADRLKLAHQWKHKQEHKEKELQNLKLMHNADMLESQSKTRQPQDQAERQELENEYRKVVVDRDKLKQEKDKAVELVKKLMKKFSVQ